MCCIDWFITSLNQDCLTWIEFQGDSAITVDRSHLILGFRYIPSLGLQGISQELETFLVHLEIGITDPRRTANLNDAVLDFQLQIIDKGLAAVQEFGKVANSTAVFDGCRTRARQIVTDNRPTALVDVVLALLLI